MDSVIGNLWAAFGPILIAIGIAALLEWRVPWRNEIHDRLRWLHAAVLTSIGFLTIWVLFPLGQIGGATFAADQGFGVFHWLGLPIWAALILGFLVLDFAEWLAHWSMHNSPLLWRLHRVHHSDEEMDVSTGFRFHPLETLYRFLVGFALVVIFGVPFEAVPLYVLVANAFNVWEHANVVVPRALARLSAVVVTPELHRIHHSDDPAHYGSNLGIVFSGWDRAFGTLVEERDPDPKFGLGPEESAHFTSLGRIMSDPMRTPQ